MATDKKIIKDLRRIGGKIWSGILYVWKRPFLISIILLVLAVFLTNLLVTKTFKPYFNCTYLLDGVNRLCDGITIDIDISPLYKNSFSILPALRAIDAPLEVFRQVVIWGIILLFALVSLGLAFVVSKITSVVKFLLTPEGRKIALTNLSIWLLFFVILCIVFYLRVVV